MRLTELNPDLHHGEDGIDRMTFDCPCGCGVMVGIRIGKTQSNSVWSFTGEFPETLTTMPSILVHPGPRSFGECKGWHGYLVSGEMKPCQ